MITDVSCKLFTEYQIGGQVQKRPANNTKNGGRVTKVYVQMSSNHCSPSCTHTPKDGSIHCISFSHPAAIFVEAGGEQNGFLKLEVKACLKTHSFTV